MKSIKEKEAEYVKTYTATAESSEAYAEKEDVTFAYEAGAYYVLNAIWEKVLTSKEFSQTQLELIMNFCEQLKK